MLLVWIAHSETSVAQTLVFWVISDLLAVDKAADNSILILHHLNVAFDMVKHVLLRKQMENWRRSLTL